jgi:hypothetical protein
VSQITDWLQAGGSVVSAIATSVTAVGVWYARHQLQTTREIAQVQFEDALDREYRALANELPKKALFGLELSDSEYEAAFDELYCYVDLCNQQLQLRQRGRISADVWTNWSEGIRDNLSLPAFKRAWTEIKRKSKSFRELRKLEGDQFASDPNVWAQF